MTIPKNFLHDKIVLLLLTIIGFLSVLETILVVLKLNTAGRDHHIIQYRANLGLNQFLPGSGLRIIEFVIFTWLIAGLHLVLSMRVYHVRRQLSVALLTMAVLFILLALIVSNSLLML